MRTILLTMLAAIMGAGGAYFTLRELDSSAAEIDFEAVVAEMQQRIDERFDQLSSRSVPSDDRNTEDAKPTPTHEPADEELADETTVADSESQLRELTESHLILPRWNDVHLIPVSDPGIFDSAHDPTPQSSKPPEDLAEVAGDDHQTDRRARERVDYRQLSEGLIEAAAALEQFNLLLNGDEQEHEEEEQPQDLLTEDNQQQENQVEQPQQQTADR